VESPNGERIVWLATADHRRFVTTVNVTATPLSVPHSCAFVNIWGDIGDSSAGE